MIWVVNVPPIHTFETNPHPVFHQLEMESHNSKSIPEHQKLLPFPNLSPTPYIFSIFSYLFYDSVVSFQMLFILMNNVMDPALIFYYQIFFGGGFLFQLFNSSVFTYNENLVVITDNLKCSFCKMGGINLCIPL